MVVYIPRAVYGDALFGNNAVISVGTVIVGNTIPDNSIVIVLLSELIM